MAASRRTTPPEPNRMWFITVIFKNLLRRKVRSLLTVVGIGIGVAAVVAMTAIAWGFERTWTRTYAN